MRKIVEYSPELPFPLHIFLFDSSGGMLLTIDEGRQLYKELKEVLKKVPPEIQEEKE